MKAKWVPVRFIGEEVRVEFDRPPALSRKPDAPSRILWGETTLRVVELLSSWVDYQRKGRMAKNMQEAHLRLAARRGSWGVGRFTFRVRIDTGQVFDVYFDRAPETAGDREGHWYLYRELRAEEG